MNIERNRAAARARRRNLVASGKCADCGRDRQGLGWRCPECRAQHCEDERAKRAAQRDIVGLIAQLRRLRLAKCATGTR